MSESTTAFTRREFLGSGLMLASAAIAAPSFIQASALAMTRALNGLSSAPGVPEDRILVVVQLSGGNDGLNTVVPFGFDAYYKARPGIAIPAKDALALPGGEGVGLHPQLAPIKALFDDGLASIVQGVGYPNPDRSHFRSMDIWHTADRNATGDGWLGKFVDAQCCGFGKGESGRAEASPREPARADAGPPAVAIGRTAPLAMQGRASQPVAFESAEFFKWSGAELHKSLREGYDALNRREASGARAGSNADFLVRTALDAQVSSDLIRKAVAKRPDVSFPQTEIGRQLQMVAQMIRAGLRTRVYYTSLGGFDTHAQQGGANGRHAQLLTQFGAAIKAFHAELRAQGNDSRVLTMSFSEFGRRVGQNASQGTDHGTAAPMFLFGPMVRPGLVGSHPSLKDLDDGDLKFGTDFRSVYAAILEDWMGAGAKDILGAGFTPAPVIRKA